MSDIRLSVLPFCKTLSVPNVVLGRKHQLCIRLRQIVPVDSPDRCVLKPAPLSVAFATPGELNGTKWPHSPKISRMASCDFAGFASLLRNRVFGKKLSLLPFSDGGPQKSVC